ncbi:unnamed protein product [Rotaria sordida]|uniref:EF-hand domain-containing protein n=2 Tax=Rotaria sordida TaxID=392033 RepID=A0A814R2W5_9BILA|nr:unnamed protein product [Rotaria sordida]CAF1195235.1 unnamed protein product [Rotaria sordida]CAF1464323.1 unnamed protein product [Rotaria sordida]
MGGKGSKKGVPKELTPKQIAMLKATTQYNEKEIREWHANFLRESPTGKLNKKQFVEAYKKFYSGGKADSYCQLAFSMFDANHDGVIDFNEYLLAVAATSQGDLDDRLEVAFDICDTSDDGQIDRKELAVMISAAYDLRGETDRKGDNDPKKRAAEIISRIDVGGDKKLNKYEFIAGCKNDPVLRRLLAPNT